MDRGTMFQKKLVLTKKMGTQIKNCTQLLQENAIFASGFKEPRILVTFDSWIKYLPKNFVVVGIIRDPLKVAESLKNRNNFSYEKSVKLWQIYNQNLLNILDKYDGFLLDFDWPKKKLLEQLKLISKKLGLASNIDLSEWYTEELFFSDKTYQKNYSLPKEIKHLYSKLKKRSIKNQFVSIKKAKLSSKENSATIGNLLNNIQFQGKYFSDIFKKQGNQFQITNKKLNKLKNEFQERSNWAQSLDEQLKQKDKKLASLQKEFDKRNTWALSLDEQLKQTSEELSYRKNEIEERSNWALSLDTQLKQRSEKFASLQKEFDKRNTWAQSLDTQLKQKDKKFASLQKEFEERTKWVQDLKKVIKEKTNLLSKFAEEKTNLLSKFAEEKTNLLSKFAEEKTKQESFINTLKSEIKEKESLFEKSKLEIDTIKKIIETKESQLEQILEELNERSFELEQIKKSVIFQILKSFTKKLEKNFPKDTKRGEAINLAKSAYLINKEKGTKELFSAFGKKSKRKLSHTKSLSKNSNPKKSKLQSLQRQKTKNFVITIPEKNFSPDQSLRTRLKIHFVREIEKMDSTFFTSIIIYQNLTGIQAP